MKTLVIELIKTSVVEKIEFKASAIRRTDEKLSAACRRGDETAWDALVDRYQRLVFTIPRRAGLSEELAAEVFQEVFLKLFEKLDDIEQPERLRSWLVTTAKFITWHCIRREKISFRSDSLTSEIDDETGFELPDESPLPDAVLLELEQQHLIRAAVNSLDERSRIIISMLFLREPPASYLEVANAIGVTETSISPLRNRSLKKLLKLLS